MIENIREDYWEVDLKDEDEGGVKKYYWGSKESVWSYFTYHIGSYMRRWILRTPWRTIRIHHILRSDYDRALHDHPFGFWTILLTGSYIEVLADGDDEKHVKRKRWTLRWVDAETPHRLILDKPVWTLVIAQHKWREWGFYVGGNQPKNWINHRDYNSHA